MSPNCPDCKRLIGTAMKCRCGWTRPADAPIVAHIDCCHTGCAANSLVRIKTDTGWGNFCQEHYIRYWSQQLAQPRERAYEFVNQHCEDVRKRFGTSRFTRMVAEVGVDAAKAEVMREPGADDEVTA